jgi:hypothetical protein
MAKRPGEFHPWVTSRLVRLCHVIDTFSRRRYSLRKRLSVITFETAQAMELLERLKPLEPTFSI